MSASFAFHHVDVFAPRPFSGNSLAVFLEAEDLTGKQMLAITQELRHFESIFLQSGYNPRHYRARIFDLLEELPFAGHPLIGAACVLHANTGTSAVENWVIDLPVRQVSVTTEKIGDYHFKALLNQGRADFINDKIAHLRADIAAWFNLQAGDLHDSLSPEVISTGLRYLVVPLKAGTPIARAKIVIPDLDRRLDELGAQFAYLLDVDSLESRHWNNDGIVEDIATGSGAGCAAAFLRRHRRIDDGIPTILRQGRFTGRPSEITLQAHGSDTDLPSIEIGGAVSLVGEGTLYGQQIAKILA